MTAPETPGSEVVVTDVREESAIHWTVRLEPVDPGDAERLRSRAAGQYVRFLGGGQGLYALASAPGAPWELLVKKQGSSMSELPLGARRRVTAPQGRGFPVAEHVGRDLLLVAAGTGIAPLRSVLLDLDRARFGRITLVYGQRRAEDFAYAAERTAWAQAGVDIVLVASQPDATWNGARGRVQDALASLPGIAGAVAYVCGMPAMVASTTALLNDAGVAEEHVFLNY